MQERPSYDPELEENEDPPDPGIEAKGVEPVVRIEYRSAVLEAYADLVSRGDCTELAKVSCEPDGCVGWAIQCSRVFQKLLEAVHEKLLVPTSHAAGECEDFRPPAGFADVSVPIFWHAYCGITSFFVSKAATAVGEHAFVSRFGYMPCTAQ